MYCADTTACVYMEAVAKGLCILSVSVSCVFCWDVHVHVCSVGMYMYMCVVLGCTCTCVFCWDVHVHVCCVGMYMYMYMCVLLGCTCTCVLCWDVHVPHDD